MKEIQFQKPSSFRATFSVLLEKPPELWGGYFCMGLFFLGALAYLSKGDIAGIATSLIMIALFKFLVDHLKKFIAQPLILEASLEGVYFPHWNLFIPFDCIKSIAENSEVRYMTNFGIVRINSLNIIFEAPFEQFMEIRKNLIRRFSWAKKLEQQSGRSLVSVQIPFTVGKGKPLNFSKDEIFYNLNRMLSDFKS